MPHGISVDLEGNVWVTDVALHQVFRFIHGSWDSPGLVLGEAFVPGNDLNHFCMPTDVAISSSGTVYISDGYCNSRILVLSASGVVEDVIENTGLEEFCNQVIEELGKRVLTQNLVPKKYKKNSKK